MPSTNIQLVPQAFAAELEDKYITSALPSKPKSYHQLPVNERKQIEWVKKNVLQMSDDDIRQIEKQKEQDRKTELVAAAHQGQIQAAQQAPMAEFKSQQDQNNGETE